MNKISDPKRFHNTVEKYVAGNLPDDLRGAIDPTAIVTVTVAVMPDPAPAFGDIFETLHRDRVVSNDAVMRVRALRDEWSDRERFLAMIQRGGSK